MELRALPHKIKNDCDMRNHRIHCVELGERNMKAKGRKIKAACSDLAPKEEYEDSRIEEHNNTLCILKSQLSMNQTRKRKLPEVVSIKSEECSSELDWLSNRDTCLPDKVKVVDSEDCCNGPRKPSVLSVDRLNKFHSVADAFLGPMNDNTGCKEKLHFKNHLKIEALTDKVGSPGANNDKHECDLKGNPITISLRRINAKKKKPRKYRFKNSTQSCLQSVIKFSRHQMHVMKFLTRTTLLELESMKDIVEGSLHSESTDNVTSSKFDMDKVKTAIERASNTKISTEFRISKMWGDCKRFCKILERLREEKVVSPTDEIGKRKSTKKVKFADEHGGVLSNVKIFERHETLE